MMGDRALFHSQKRRARRREGRLDRVPPAPIHRLMVVALALVGVLFAGALGKLALGVHTGQLNTVDFRLALAIRVASAGRLSFLARLLGRVGGAEVWDTLMLVVAAALFRAHRRSTAAILIVGLVCAEASTILVNALIGGPRQSLGDLIHFLAIDGFPSGHVVRVIVSVGVLATLPRSWTFRLLIVVAAVGCALLMGWARIATRSHSPSEIVGALLLGSLVLDVLFLGHLWSIRKGWA